MIRPFPRESHTFADPTHRTNGSCLSSVSLSNKHTLTQSGLQMAHPPTVVNKLRPQLAIPLPPALTPSGKPHGVELLCCEISLVFSSHTFFSIWRTVLSTSDAALARRRTGRLDCTTYGRDLPSQCKAISRSVRIKRRSSITVTWAASRTRGVFDEVVLAPQASDPAISKTDGRRERQMWISPYPRRSHGHRSSCIIG